VDRKLKLPEDLLTSELAALHAETEQLHALGSFVAELGSTEAAWSDNLFRLFGLAPSAVAPSPEYVVSRTHPDDVEKIRAAIDRGLRSEEPIELMIRITMPDGDIRHLDGRSWTSEDADGRKLVLGCVRDVTQRERGNREIAAHLAVAEALVGWKSLASSGEMLLWRLGEALGLELGILWVPIEGTLRARTGWSASPGRDWSAYRDARLAPGEGVAGRAWQSREPEFMFDVQNNADYELNSLAVQNRTRGALAIPVLTGTSVLAVLGFGSSERLEPTDRLKGTLTGIGYELGTFLSHHVGELTRGDITDREREILQLAANGLSGPQIAEQLSVSMTTVKTHFHNIYRKYAVSDRPAAVARALRDGEIS
jgi:PAS domain S-box-containing protein